MSTIKLNTDGICPGHLARNAWSLQENNARSLQENSQSERAYYCCHIINTLNDSSLGKQLSLFPDTLKNIKIRNFGSWKSIKPHCNGGRRSTFAGNSALLPSDCCQLIDFGGKQFHC